MQQGAMALLLVLLPFSKAAVEITFGLLLLGWLLRWGDPKERPLAWWHQPRLRVLVWWGLAFLVICGASVLWSSHPSLSARGFVSKWLEYLLLFAMVAELAARSPSRFRVVLWVLAGSSLLVVIEAVSQERWGSGLLRGYPLGIYGRMTGPYENPIDLATYLMVVLPILLAGVLTHRRAAKWTLIALMGLLGGGLLRTKALGAWIGLAIGMVMVFSGHRDTRRPMLLVLAGLALGGLLFLRPELARIASPSEPGKVDRIYMWRAAIGMIGDRPWLGQGVNTFMANYLDYWVGGEQQPRYAHNCYLQMAAEVGLIGLSAFLGLLGTLVRQIASGLTRLGREDRLLLMGYLAGLLAFVAQAAVDTNFYSLRQAALFWTLAGLSLGLTSSSNATFPTSQQVASTFDPRPSTSLPSGKQVSSS